MTEFTVPRRRGRPRAGTSDARERILAAATEEFGENGYDGATMRGIAARAQVDAALVHHHFGTKADLFSAVVDVPMRPDLAIPEILRGPQQLIGERIVRYVLELWEQPDVRRKGVALVRAGIGNKLTTPLLAGFLSRELLGRIGETLELPDADFRTGLVASQIGGLVITRYVLRLPQIASASVDDIVQRVGPTIQGYLFD